MLRLGMAEPSSPIRERASDWVVIGPVVGFTNQTTTRVLVQPFTDQRDQLELRIAKAAPGARFSASTGGFGPIELDGSARRIDVGKPGDFGTVLFEVGDLEPGTRYFYEVVPKSAPAEVAGVFASRQPYSLSTLPKEPTAMKFAFFSCNGGHKPPRGCRPMAMWTRLLTEALGDADVHLALLGGDQIYGDVIREEWLREWEPDFDPNSASPSEAERFHESLAELPERYERLYRSFWRRPEIRTFMGHMPCLMTWDDHDIYDGWGSYGNESLPAQQGFFKAAARAFDAFQFSLAPIRPLSNAALAEREGHRAFSFMAGDVAFVVLDLRSKRNIRSREVSAVLGDRQWRWLIHEFDEIKARKPKQVVVVSSIPVVHTGAVVEHLLPSAAELHDDVLDHWSSRPNRNDQAKLVGRLFDLRKHSGANVLILSGDVHVATIGDIRSTDPRFLRDGEREAIIYQGVSSSIAYESPTGISANAVRYLVVREHPVHGGFNGRISELIAERNFAVVSCQKNKVLRFTLFHEGSDVPEQYYFGAG
jgi:phosphodiesterase/alkaline phosphatase D-like protein